MSFFSERNPLGDNGQNGRIDDIKASFASGRINKKQYDELIEDEASVTSALRMKYAALAIMLGIIGFLFILSNL